MKGASLLIFAAIAMSVVYAGLAVAIPPEAFFSGYEGVQWLQTDSIIRHRWTSLAVDPPGGDLDPEARFLPPFLVEKQGRIRSIHPAFMPLLASLPYAVAGMRGMYLIPAISAILCLVAATSLARSVLPPGTPGGWAALAGAAAVAGSPLIFYGATLWEHAQAAALCTLAMIPLCRGGRDDESAAPEPGRAVAAGFLIGLAAVARTEAALLLPAAALGGALAWGLRAFLRPAA
ncbi:MAG TPA: hypothetical protein VFP98_08380, partial [Candidatus Polarisedimenticolia bacterium]|nr:hypothetical protein [Candidatus Polarisedimenticolia bacterium]